MTKLSTRQIACVLMAIGGLLLLAGGCSRDGLPLAPVEGVVALDRTPIADAAVMFAPRDGGPVATAVTDAAGRFELHTTNEVGALIGEHRVTISKQVVGNLVDGVPGPGGVKISWLIPRNYSRADTSGLTATVERGDNEVSFDLKSK